MYSSILDSQASLININHRYTIKIHQPRNKNTMNHIPYGMIHRGNQLRFLGCGRCWRANSVLPRASMGHSWRRISNSWLSWEQSEVENREQCPLLRELNMAMGQY